MPQWEGSQNAFAHAARLLAQIAPAGVGRWTEHALGEWNVRDLLGHASLALLTVESYLDQPAPTVEVASPADYFTRMTTGAGAAAGIAERGRAAGAALGDDPAEAVAAIVDRVPQKIRHASEGSIVSTPAGGMRLADYLPTRTFELTVHTCDLGAALGRSVSIPESSARESFQIIGQLAAHSETAADLLLAATGRRHLARGFSVLSEEPR